MSDKKKPVFKSEIIYLISITVLAFAVAMLSAADFGVSMIVAPAYILSSKLTFLTFGQAEYVLQSVLFVALCILLKRIKATYFSSFITCIIYGGVLDLWRAVIPVFNPDITPPGSMALPVRIVFFVVGLVLTSFSIALGFKSYLYPQVYDFFVKAVSSEFGKERSKFKSVFDLCCLAASVIMTLVLFGKFVGVKFGTVIIACVNGVLIGIFDRSMSRLFTTEPIFKKLASKFDFAD